MHSAGIARYMLGGDSSSLPADSEVRARSGKRPFSQRRRRTGTTREAIGRFVDVYCVACHNRDDKPRPGWPST